ncbi:MAG: hypothetical protein KDD82_19745 [Planctomycetes bacterium]|nr:hypothetical protein [Planctomycetota bacterium]
MTHHKLRAIGDMLREEESRFIGYPEIERKSKELGFGVTVRTLRFYVDESILPPPKKVGKAPVYEEEWILNALLSIHLMKTRLSRSLTEIRTVLGRLQEDPTHLADKLSVLYEEYVRTEQLKPLERSGLQDTFFALLCGKVGPGVQPSELRLTCLADTILESGRWEGERWIPPSERAILIKQGLIDGPTPEDLDLNDDEEGPAEDSERASLDGPSLEPPPPPPTPPPAGAITAARARAVEEAFTARFELAFEVLGRVHCPLDGKAYKAGPRERTLIKRDQSGRVVDLMKRCRVYDRSLLDEIPLNEVREYQVFQRSLFGRGELKVVVAAVCVSPLEPLITERHANEPLGLLEAERILDGLSTQDGVFYYVGILSPVGWDKSARERVPSRRNTLVCLVEPRDDGSWTRHRPDDPRWAGVDRVFDPETDREKIDRVGEFLLEALKPKGEFLILKNLEEDLDVPAPFVSAAVEEVLVMDRELEVAECGGRHIIKRRRL